MEVARTAGADRAASSSIHALHAPTDGSPIWQKEAEPGVTPPCDTSDHLSETSRSGPHANATWHRGHPDLREGASCICS